MVQRSRPRDRAEDTELMFRRLLQNAHDLVYRYRIQPTRGYDYINEACRAITGRGPNEFYANPKLVLSCVHPDDRHIVKESFQDDPAKLSLAIQIRWVHPDGKIVWAEHHRVPVLDDRGQLIAIEGVGRDITQRVETQNRLSESESQLRGLTAGLQAAREAERAHLSRELHDELGQMLTTLKMDLTRTVRDLLPLQLPPAQIDRMQSMVGTIEVATETVRRLATALRPPALDHLGLAAAIELEAAAVSRRTGVRCRMTGAMPAETLTSEQSTAVFRIVQEALTNVVRHSGASAVRIDLRQRAAGISVRIQDNGRGIAGREVNDPASIGLRGMRERAELIGGRLEISGQRGKGTVILISVPCDASQEATPA